MTTKIIYEVHDESGEYEDYCDFIIARHTTKEGAKNSLLLAKEEFDKAQVQACLCSKCSYSRDNHNQNCNDFECYPGDVDYCKNYTFEEEEHYFSIKEVELYIDEE